MKKAMRVLALILAVMMMFTTVSYAEDNLKYIEEGDAAELFNMVAADLVDLYQFDITKDKLLERTFTNLLNNDPDSLDSFLRALFDSLDEYSEFYTPEEYRELTQSLENVTGGIGIYMTEGPRYIEVMGLTEGSPAGEAGVKPGDKILKVNGEDMSGKGSNYVSGKVRGDIGTEVTITVLRDNEQFDVTITRGPITQNTVSYANLGSGVGYLYISTFSSATEREVKSALEAFDSAGIKKIILDLRYNPGGFVDAAVNVAKMFVPAGIIVTHNIKYGDQTEVFRSDLKTKKYEMVTLVNEYSASAAELLASALQDSGASKLVGEQTYGKAVTQAILHIYGGRMCKVTSGEYITRNGKKINKVGIAPNYVVENEEAILYDTNEGRMKFAPSYNEGDEDEGIYDAELRLDLLGYNVGRVDSKYDEEMTYAVMAFQKDIGLNETGILDINTQMYLSDKTNDIVVPIDNQLKKAYEMMGLEYTGYALAR